MNSQCRHISAVNTTVTVHQFQINQMWMLQFINYSIKV